MIPMTMMLLMMMVSRVLADTAVTSGKTLQFETLKAKRRRLDLGLSGFLGFLLRLEKRLELLLLAQDTYREMRHTQREKKSDILNAQ